MTEPVPRSSNTGRTLARGDVVCLLAFVVVGQALHGTLTGLGSVWRGFWETGFPILLAWFLIAPFLRTYARPSWRNLMLTWALSVSVGVVFRFLVLGQPFSVGFFVFWAVGLGFTLLFLLVWRGLALRLQWWRPAA
ncbi:MAG: DUF3054 domain-containing protein [Meiothermus sp.]|nr:DUF3054 domain-containing protein [Meiothermus sp.]